jgi:signal transduction histidine kinase
LLFSLISAKILALGIIVPPDSAKKTVGAVNKQNIDKLNKLAEARFESFPDSTLYYAMQAIGLSKKINYLPGIADGYMQLAAVNTFKGDYEAANAGFSNALRLYARTGNRYGVTEAYIGMGRIQDYLGNYTRAIQLFDKALLVRRKHGDEMEIANCYAIMGITYDNKGEFSTALDYYFKSLIIDLKHNDELGAADNYCNIGVIMQQLELYPKALGYLHKALDVWIKKKDEQGLSTAYQNIGEVLLAQKHYPGAINYIRKASTIFRRMDDEEGISLIDYDLGLYHYYTHRPDSAVSYFTRSLQSASQKKIKYNKAYAYCGMAMVYNQLKKYATAYNYALLAQITANKLGSIYAQANAALQLGNALAGLKQFEQAYKQHLLYSALKDSLKSDENIQKLISYNLELDFEKRQGEIAKQQQQQELIYKEKIADQKKANIVYTLIILLMTVLLGVYYSAKRKQQQINQLLTAKNIEVLSQKNDLNIQADKLNDLNNLKDRLIGVLAHDLRAPLSTLHGLFALMTEKDITHQEFIEMAPGVFSKLESTSDFLDTLLFWINSQVDNIEHTTQSFCLCDLVEHELLLLDEQLMRKRLSVKNNVSKSDTVLADPNSIRIVIHNLLTNAIKFSVRGTTIELATYQHDDGMRVFVVKDEGIGMGPNYLDNLFKSKVNSMLGTDNELGTGMGLLFCKDLIEKYNGRIWATSIVGKGTQLYFALPPGITITENTLTEHHIHSSPKA